MNTAVHVRIIINITTSSSSISSSSITSSSSSGGGRAYGSVVGLKHYATIRKVEGSIPDESSRFFNRPNSSCSTMTLGSTQPLTETSTRNLREGKGRPVRKADNLTTTCKPIV
jgi:hypothetical protein